jgi:FkbM family methyltransferase
MSVTLDDKKTWRGWTLPAAEEHLPDWMQKTGDVRFGRPTYQARKYDSAMAYTRRRRMAIDIGANVGLWSWLMAKDFDQLHAFEPVPLYAQCWRANVEGLGVHLHQLALGEEAGRVNMVNVTEGSFGDTTVDVGQGGAVVGEQVEVRTLDSYCFNEVDLIKCDNEGYELFVMRGAVKTITRCRPTIIVEQKPGHGEAFGVSDTAAVEFLEGLGMQVQNVIAGDYILTF